MAYEIPTYQFLVTRSEMKLLHSLRDMVPEEETEDDKIKLRSPLQLMAYAGDRHLGDFPVDGMNLVSDCANVGAQLRDIVLNHQIQTDLQEDPALEEETSAASPAHLIDEAFDEEPVPWDEVRAHVIPSYVRNVIFTVNKNDLDQEHRDDLEERFPDVSVQESGSNISAKRYGGGEQPFEKPHGVKSAIFHLEKDLPSSLGSNIQKQYPWARVRLPYVPTGKRANQDIENHIQDFAEYMIEYPQSMEFDAPMDQNLSWDLLPLRRRVSIAHARAIQHGRWGQTLSDPCTNCKKNGFKCRVYRPAFISNSHSTIQLDLGKGCQHCRLRDVECDSPAFRENSEPTSAANTLSPHSGRDHSADPSNDATRATSPPSRKLSLAARMSRSTLPDAHDHAITQLKSESDMYDLCQQLGFKEARHNHLWTMYLAWTHQQTMRAFSHGYMQLQLYYANLVDLYIIARAKKDPALEFATLLQFQVTNFQEPDKLPSIKRCATRAFEHLPINSPLCRWMAILFFHEWDSVSEVDCDGMVNDKTITDLEPLSKFLYGIVSAGGSHARGGKGKVLERWCSVHNHLPNSSQDQSCMAAERDCKYKFQEMLGGSNKTIGKRSFEGLPGNITKKFKQNNKINGSQSTKSSGNTTSAARRTQDRNSAGICSVDLDNAFDGQDQPVERSGERRRSKRQAEKRASHSKKYRSTLVVLDSDEDDYNNNADNDESEDEDGDGDGDGDGDEDEDKIEDEDASAAEDSGSIMSAMLDVDHVTSLGPVGESEFDPSDALGSVNKRSKPSLPVRARRQPRKTTPQSETPTSERRSARASAQAMPSGYFRQRVPRKEFGKTMWNGFKG